MRVWKRDAALWKDDPQPGERALSAAAFVAEGCRHLVDPGLEQRADVHWGDRGVGAAAAVAEVVAIGGRCSIGVTHREGKDVIDIDVRRPGCIPG